MYMFFEIYLNDSGTYIIQPLNLKIMETATDLNITDPVHSAGKGLTPFKKLAMRFIVDERDLPFVKLSLIICTTTIPAAIYLFVSSEFSWWAGILYFLYNSIFLMGPYILMLHNTSHRIFFKRKYNILNRMIHWLFGPFFGETPESYFAHHIGMHHPENNLTEDLSSTMNYRRDSIRDFIRYFSRFFFFILPDLSTYLRRKGRKRLMRRYLIGESMWYITVLALMFVNWQATLVVFVIPLIFTRFMMMAGNWAQHAFIDTESPDNCYRNSITCINSAYNRRCFNDGYHISHHLHPSMHWTYHPISFQENIKNYETEEAVVFRKLDYFMIWFLLMTKSYDTLAKYFVDLSPNRGRTKLQIASLLKERTRKCVASPV